ncbi:Arc family DNA-binding protein [Halalkalibacterium halodurans]|nr:Arc family DNA-binding protein [Halalkalibacterium halodurans]MED4083902.1 Arc family DNA-binding protein [Halalkalibacterium halodurans]MED4105539.1 Arc family DNA-binding protein [Halalkalibacterium halodurans]MED4109255.1 Arc family DNA-binding protein [Halalkalibacterium halodurans]MED4149731.1 Arc family DNA-binding protein [Halalkalibacterium halodurans]
MSDTKRFTLRLNNDLFEKVKEEAEKNKRSVAKEMEYILELQIKNKN